MANESPGTGDPSGLLFTYQKGQHFRMIHVDGAHGGLAPSGRYIHMALYSERRSIPKEQVFPFAQDGSLGGEPIRTQDIGGVFREVEACAVMDVVVARAIHKWLGDRIDEYERVRDVIKKLHGSDERK